MSMVGFGAVISFGLVSGTVFPLALSGPAAVWVYLAAAAMLVLLVGCMAALTMAGPVPLSFGEAISHQLGRGAACFTRGAYFLAVTAIVGTEIAFLPPALRPWMPWAPNWLIALSGLLLLAVVIGHGAKAFARLEVALSVMKIGAVLGLLAMSCRVIGSREDVPALGASWLRSMLRADSGALWTSFVLATLGFVGIESLSLAARETSAAPPVLRARMVAVARLLALLVWVTVVVTSVLIHTGAVPLRLPPSQYLLALLSEPSAHRLFGALIAVTVLSVANSQLYGATRTLHESARAGELPGCLGRLDAGSPRVATLAAFLCSSAVFLVAAYDGQDAFRVATAIATIGALAVWSMIFMAALRFASGGDAGGRTRSLKIWQALLGLLVTLMIAISLPFMDFFGPAIWLGVPPLLVVGVGAAVLARGRGKIGAAI
jgi:L-asparagine transporter-like permease